MIPGSHAALPATPDEQDHVARLERFRAAHPGVPVLLLGACPKAWIGDQKIENRTLRGLLDDLEEFVRPDAHTFRAGTPQ